MNSFFSYARQLQTLREGIKTDEQKEIFDMEVNIIVNFIQIYRKNSYLKSIVDKILVVTKLFYAISDSVMDTTYATEGKSFQYR